MGRTPKTFREISWKFRDSRYSILSIIWDFSGNQVKALGVPWIIMEAIDVYTLGL